MLTNVEAYQLCGKPRVLTEKDKKNLAKFYDSVGHREYLKWEKNPSLLRQIASSVASMLILLYCIVRRIVKGE